MTAQVVMEPGWEVNVQAAVRHLLADEIGPLIEADARRYCPVGKGSLRDSVKHGMDGDTLVVSAQGSDERTYAAYVELGHRVAHGKHGRVGPEVVPPEPFLRPALMQQRNP